MPVFRSDGTRVSRDNVSYASEEDPIIVLQEDLYFREPYGATDPVPYTGSKRTLLSRGNRKMRMSEFNQLFPLAKLDSASVTEGPQPAGTTVTLTGTGLHDVVAVGVGFLNEYGGMSQSQTVLTHVSYDEIRLTLPEVTHVGDIGYSIQEHNGEQVFPILTEDSGF